MLAIVIPTLNEPRLPETLAALAAQTAPNLMAQVIVVGVQPGWRAPDGVQFIQTPHPVSAAEARNLGAARATAPGLIFLDADCIPQPNFVARMAGALRDQTLTGGAIALEPAPYWVMCDNALAFADTLSGAPRGERAYLPSYALAMRRATFEQLGGFDQTYRGANWIGEDVDLCARAKARGCAILFEPDARVAHRPARASAQAVWRHMRAYGSARVRLSRAHPGVARSPLAGMPRGLGWMVALAAPFLALADVAALFATRPQLRGFWRAAPGMVWGKLAWYAGAAAALSAKTG